MRVLLIGSGGREHALAWHLRKHSPQLDALFIAPGNLGTAECGTNVAIKANDHDGLVNFARQEKIDLVICGPEAPLVDGIYDQCVRTGIKCVGPSKVAAQLEGSKQFTKEICDAASIPTADWKSFDDPDAARRYLDCRKPPFVIKADGLASGKGVIIAHNTGEAEKAIDSLMQGGAFGGAGHKIVIEDYLEGEEISLFAACCGEKGIFLGAAQDHKRLNNGGEGPNTGGMGAISPLPNFTASQQQAYMDRFIRPALRDMARRGTPFEGILFAGIICTPSGPKLLEYNVRFGDPEAETILPLIDSDLLPVFDAIASHKLDEKNTITFKDKIAICVILAAEGYPVKPRKGVVIEGACTKALEPFTTIFQCGTKRNELRQLEVNGGRVMAITSVGKTARQARELVYRAAQHIHWPGMHYRTDIGASLL